MIFADRHFWSAGQNFTFFEHFSLQLDIAITVCVNATTPIQNCTRKLAIYSRFVEGSYLGWLWF